MATDKRKQSIYIPLELLEEIKAEAKRLDRSMSWVIQYAWRKAREDVAAIPSAHLDS